MLALTNDGLVRLTPAGRGWRSWRLRTAGGAQLVSVDPHEPDVLYLGTRGDGLWTSLDAGEQWTRLDLPARDVFALAVSRADGCLYAGCEPSQLFASRDRGRTWRECQALRDLPSAPTWSFPPRPWTSHVSAIAPHPRDPALLLVGIELGGLMRSEDGGETWQDHRSGAQRDVHALAWHPSDDRRAYQAAGGGAASSQDRGGHWTAADEGRDRHYCWALAVSPAAADTWFVSASPSARHAHGGTGAAAGVYRRRGAAPWELVVEGLPRPLDDMPYALAAHEDRLFVGLRSGRIFVSEDEGGRWSELDVIGDEVDGVRGLTVVASR